MFFWPRGQLFGYEATTLLIRLNHSHGCFIAGGFNS
jgi:hypothetical protein